MLDERSRDAGVVVEYVAVRKKKEKKKKRKEKKKDSYLFPF